MFIGFSTNPVTSITHSSEAFKTSGLDELTSEKFSVLGEAVEEGVVLMLFHLATVNTTKKARKIALMKSFFFKGPTVF
ncbi:hypothetical protein TSIB_1974 [Thermococcus sibiricus MM 739]|uniref:Uncharacterized protein n=1 Tax=Thermococcus sibiricus (strain DSM 12597 / MM 739) TaxID=604354 RepID=C6A042_THESM|nr:hypothetical protein TSIB_1974 [Thermococcus sibiricus MM 739]